MKYIPLILALMAPAAMAGPEHANLFHACGKPLILEFHGPRSGGVVTRDMFLESEEIRQAVKEAEEAAVVQERSQAFDLTALLNQLFGWTCPTGA